NKTLWYNRYDVTALLNEGENCIAAVCGNGFYNESFTTSWDHNKAAWRDNPKFILRLDIDGQTALTSDTEWRFCPNPPITYNHLRSGEYFDSRLYQAGWNTLGFDDAAWKPAVIDDTPPKGVFRECLCEPIREFEAYKPVRVLKN
ncbi:MAG: alpha-L-rhamnosidase N-terminal domain-containing protein, partial [Eubacteriales bacterium]|nr:alpha-L-rhamnosidase N-terminal domain-containing protein [Eubacteriales bacterium]